VAELVIQAASGRQSLAGDTRSWRGGFCLPGWLMAGGAPSCRVGALTGGRRAPAWVAAGLCGWTL